VAASIAVRSQLSVFGQRKVPPALDRMVQHALDRMG
jgi:hypothetical protein